VISEAHRRQILTAQQAQKPLVITTHTFLPNAQGYVDRLLKNFLDELGVSQLFDPLSFCVRELAVNAKKANTKRLYFEVRNLDPHNPDDYHRGMTAFKRDTLDDQDQYLRLLKDRGYTIKIEFLKWGNSCSVAVRNSVEVLPAELERVKDKIEKSRGYASLEDALGEVLDETEGAGLGIVVLILMLKRLGFTGDFFQFYTVEGETVARIILPLTLD
jgi:hypothetical protein